MKRIAVLPHAFARRVAALDKPVRMGLAGTLALSTIAAGSLVYAAAASAAVPAFPDNIVVFPDRDFIAIEGYQDKVGSTATILVRRNGEITGKAEGTIAEGDPAIEVNHPGGVCWGTGADAPNVTPDIIAGDVVELLIDGELVGETTTGSGTLANNTQAPASAFQGPPLELNGGTLLIRGTVGADIVLAQGEQRIIAPDLVDTDVQRRDVRAVPGPLTPAPRGGYSSMLEFENGGLGNGPTRFLATYVFEDGVNNTAEELAAIAAAGGPRYMSWQVEDLDANRQGLTIAEFGELGGPGMGGCPNGPLQSGPPAPTNITATKTTSGPGEEVTFSWTPAVPVPGTPAITGYRVRAVGAADVDGNQAEVGLRVNDPAATGATLQVPFTPYTLEVTSRNAENNETNPPSAPIAQDPDTTAPAAVTITPGSGAYVGATEFTIASEPGADIFYQLSTGPTAPLMHLGGGVLSGDETLYTGPLTLDTNTRLSAVAVDAAGNVSDQTDVDLTFSTASPPADPPGNVAPTAGNGSFTVTWEAVTTAVPAVTGYVITWSGPENGSVDVGTTPLTKTVTGLDPGQYTVTVAAKNVGGTGEASTGVTVDIGEEFSVSAGANTSVTRGGAGVTLEATTPNGNVTYLWERVTSDALNADAVTSPTYLTNGTTASPTVTLPNVALPTNNTFTPAQAADARATALFYRVTMFRDDLPVAQDVVRVAVTQATVTIATGRYRAGSELRLEGSVTNAGATVRIYSRANGAADDVNYTFIGTATVTAAPGGATWTLRLRNGAVPPNRPWYAFSTAGGGAGPFTT